MQVVMGDYKNNMELVDKVVALMPDLSLVDFTKLLDMRNVKEKTALIESFSRRWAKQFSYFFRLIAYN